MHLEIESLELSQKRVHVTIPARKVDSALSSAFNRISQTLNLSGFRRGRIPMSYLRKRYGAQAAAEATERLVDQAWREAINEHGVNPVAQPKFDFKPVKPGKEYTCDITVEVAPEFELPAYDSFQLEKTEWQVSDEVIAHELEHIAEQFPVHTPIEDRDEARDGDRVHFSYLGRINGEAFEGGADEDGYLVLGSGQFIPGFEPQIIGHKIGEKFDVNVTFPEDYQAPDLAGQAAVFECELKGLESVSTPELDDDLAIQAGAENLEDLKAKVKERVLAVHDGRTKDEMKEALKKLIAERLDFELPSTPLEQLMEQKKRSAVLENEGEAPAELDEEALAQMTAEAKDELRVEFLMDAIAEKEELEVTQQEFQAFLGEMIQHMGPYAQQFLQFYRDPKQQAAIRERILRDKVLDFLISKANVTLVSESVPVHKHDDEHDHDHE